MFLRHRREYLPLSIGRVYVLGKTLETRRYLMGNGCSSTTCSIRLQLESTLEAISHD